jgi:PAS domain S-box-containing protein
MDHTDIEKKIKAFLKQQPHGLTISDIASGTGINRNAAAKYLKVLEVRGEVDSYMVGTGKIFVLSHRLPISALFELAPDLVCTIDDRQFLTFANKNFSEFFGFSEHAGSNRHVREVGFHKNIIPDPAELILSLLTGEVSTQELTFFKDGRYFYFRTKVIPTLFSNGLRSTTILFDEMTKEQEYLKNLEFLAKTAADLADMTEDDDIYQYIADRLAELEPKAHINVMSINPDTRVSSLRAISGDPEFNQVIKEVLAPFGNVNSMSFDMDKTPEAMPALTKGVIVEGPRSLYIMAFRSLPEKLCNEIEERLQIEKHYTMGCVCRGGLYGSIAMRFRKGDDLENRATIVAFIRQAGVALQRQYLKEKLKRTEEKLHALETRTPPDRKSTDNVTINEPMD